MTHKASILVVDDEPDNFDVIETLLHQEGYQLHYASNGIKALKRLDKISCDLILLDVMMPEIDGIEVCRQIKANSDWHHIPILIITALNSKEDLSRCLEAGADDFISKPVNSLELRARIRSLLRIKQQYDALKDALKFRQDMANMIVHDLRNPLTNVIAACELLELADLNQNQRKWLDLIETSGKHLGSLLDSLLMMAKFEAKKITLTLMEVNLSEMAKAVVEDFQAMAHLYEIKLSVNVPNIFNIVELDRNLIRRVFDNLLTNAIKYSPSKTEVTLQISYPHENQVKIQVFDQGNGISEELKQRIFKKFEIGPSLGQEVKQTGLGLAFCKMAVEAHGGTIYVEDNHPKGSIFTVEIELQSSVQ